MVRAVLLAAFALSAGAAAAEPSVIKANVSVDEAVANLTTTVEQAGAKVFAVIDHQAGAESIGAELRPTTKVIFGNPRVGTPAMAEAQGMGMFLPMQMLIWEDAAGDVWIMTPDVDAAAAQHGLSADHPSIGKMKGALGKMASAAAG